MVILLPFHQDTGLSEDAVELPPGLPVTVIDPELPGGDQWTLLVNLFGHLAEAVRATQAPVTVVTGDCLATVGTPARVLGPGTDQAFATWRGLARDHGAVLLWAGSCRSR